ncbi:hypothetical protein ONA70_36060 [Micromonospora yasonensis]|uniref:hypothetical protein n=1 Tax=Micromonospora yasonensis TaxID=1128667 RepID=UPI0022314891|nr:hypothetical protein [Micromonospora yasonensis]MCW3845493.1 hypothetical protein [Micromonospora yasonensis]
MRADDRHPQSDDESAGDVGMPDRVRLTLRDRLILALLACVVAAAIGVVVAWATGDTSGIVADKREVQITECGGGCRLKTCHQVTYVTDARCACRRAGTTGSTSATASPDETPFFSPFPGGRSAR